MFAAPASTLAPSESQSHTVILCPVKLATAHIYSCKCFKDETIPVLLAATAKGCAPV